MLKFLWFLGKSGFIDVKLDLEIVNVIKKIMIGGLELVFKGLN